MRSTYEKVSERLAKIELLYRYSPGYAGAESREGTFAICSFWAVDNLGKRGEVGEAERQFEHVLSYATDLGLFSEEIDPEGGIALGNFPQAFTHVSLINAALAIEHARKGH
jgi:GH15 family glucan-1,4-alpha-glucosidase